MANTFGKLGGGEIETALAATVLLFSARGKSARGQTVSDARGTAQARGGDAVPLVCAPALRLSSIATGDGSGDYDVGGSSSDDTKNYYFDSTDQTNIPY